MSLTQIEIAEHLDLDQSAVSRFLAQADLNLKTSNLDEIRVLYIRKLRGNAAGHRTEGGDDLVRERVLTERVDREMKIYTLAEKKGSLINVAQLEPELMQMMGAFKSELISRDDKLRAALEAEYGIKVDVQLLNDYTYAALSHLARYEPRDSTADVPADGIAESSGADRPN